jgi:hypothetical protein
VLETRFGFVILPGLGNDSRTKAGIVPTARLNIDSQFLLVFRAPLIKGPDSKLVGAAPIASVKRSLHRERELCDPASYKTPEAIKIFPLTDRGGIDGHCCISAEAEFGSPRPCRL